ncbi:MULTISPECIES: thioesterase family protein [Virgibacillus]|uniref:thioesterase family protein n=1 Tax=Virgibacillus TaxID=84406 RepID=UPI0003884468|nr:MULTISPECIES: hypothetical protein [Virgibacillus]EQB37161.1 hypothetical protein M948_09780 [Virgibacillus sp. CM-4]MYL43475.1 thioesterase [Virgibacillus massiliensis]
MKEGLCIGDTKTITVEVTREMFAQFGGEVVHPVYSTASMVYHMEWVSRQCILPYLEENEEAMGAAVALNHIAPSALGTNVKLTAAVSEITKRMVTTELIVENDNGRIGEGEVRQAILPKHIIQEKVRAASIGGNVSISSQLERKPITFL